MNCVYCKALEKGAKPIYEDDLCFALLVNSPAAPGHAVLLPKKHYAILEQMPDDLASHMFIVANKLGAVLFQATSSEGNNIIVQNGVAAGQSRTHFMMHIMPRKQGDGVDFTWQAKQVSEEDLSTVELKIVDVLGGGADEKVVVQEAVTDAEQYLLDELNRLP